MVCVRMPVLSLVDASLKAVEGEEARRRRRMRQSAADGWKKSGIDDEGSNHCAGI